MWGSHIFTENETMLFVKNNVVGIRYGSLSCWLVQNWCSSPRAAALLPPRIRCWLQKAEWRPILPTASSFLLSCIHHLLHSSDLHGLLWRTQLSHLRCCFVCLFVLVYNSPRWPGLEIARPSGGFHHTQERRHSLVYTTTTRQTQQYRS